LILERRYRFGLLLATATATCLVAIETTRAQSGLSAPGAVAHMSLEEARRFFVCRTHMSFNSGHGTQVFFVRPDGTEFLWYPGNRVIVVSKWQLVQRLTSSVPPIQYADLCFQYGTNTYNPVTKQQGGQWECRPAGVVAKSTVERARGDVFGLARRLPFVLARDRTSMGALQKHLQALRPTETQPEAAEEQTCARGVSSLTRKPSLLSRR